MRNCVAFLILTLLQSGVTIAADEIVFTSGPTQTHLLELFTSEGCSSCPPAEAWLSKLKENKQLWRDFVPLAFHVDYWDRLGWRDRFASKDWTMRQQVFAAHWNSGSVYTPGFVLDGNESSAIVPRNSQENVGTLRLKLNGDEARISFVPAKSDSPGYEAYLACLGFDLSSNVKAGENNGRKLSHDFVVLALQKAPIRAATETKLKIDNSKPDKVGALAVWVTRANDQVPIQATGGWLGR